MTPYESRILKFLALAESVAPCFVDLGPRLPLRYQVRVAMWRSIARAKAAQQ